ncbi:type IV secretory system conjugative DNA transfer family protein [Halococcus agarilyticus]|uniref:type IV secretory system conjugative DNA transfer family protein n=1 Tax=Halococcus agarilyticus TaxID=1232219 RepID=UPI0006782884|nr:type IV secretion system DNA-binding domain-containing protein [Halococcus agarilyticus]
MYAGKDYQERDASALTSYIGREQLYNASGEEMDGEEIQAFIDRSEDYEYEEQWILSPENGEDLSDEAMSLAARKTLNQHIEERPTAEYCYAIHRDTDHPHVQAAVTGEKADLWTDEEDLQNVRENARDHFQNQEREHGLEEQLLEENVLEPDHENAHSQSRTLAAAGLPITVASPALSAVTGILLPLQGRTPYGFWTDLGITIVAFVIPGIIALYLLYRIYRDTRDYLTKRWMRGVVADGDYPLPIDVEEVQPKRPWWKPRIIEAISVSGEGGMFVLGESGSGKTETIKLLVHPWVSSPTDSYVVFDYKGDWESHFADDDVIKLSISDSTHHWNIFREAERESDFDEIAGALFQSADDSDDFFPKAARQLFGAVLKYLYREFDEDDEFPTNADLVSFCESTTPTELYDALTEYPDLVAAASALDPEAEGQASGVFATFQQQVQEVFSGDFAKAGNFSVRDYIQDPQGRKLLLRYDPRRGQSTKPAFSFFMEWAIRYSLDSDLSGESYFLLDEFARVPAVGNMEELVNVGRGMGARAILGIQSYKQVTDTYNRDRGDALLDGLTRGVIKRVNANTVQHAQGLIAEQWHIREISQYDNDGVEVAVDRERELKQAFSDDQLTSLAVDDSIVIQNDGWVHGRLPLLDEEREAMDYAAGRTEEREPDQEEPPNQREPEPGTEAPDREELPADD